MNKALYRYKFRSGWGLISILGCVAIGFCFSFLAWQREAPILIIFAFLAVAAGISTSRAIYLNHECGCEVDEINIRWWTRLPSKSKVIYLSEIESANFNKGDSSSIQITTKNQERFTIPDACIGDGKAIWEVLSATIPKNSI